MVGRSERSNGTVEVDGCDGKSRSPRRFLGDHERGAEVLLDQTCFARLRYAFAKIVL